MSIADCRIIELPKISDFRGSLTFVENQNHIPFKMKRVYYMYNLPQDAERGAHGHKNLHQLLIPVAGNFDVILDDGWEKKTFHVDQPYKGLYICPMIWRRLTNFSNEAVCLVLASELYLEDDYFRNYQSFLDAARGRNHEHSIS